MPVKSLITFQKQGPLTTWHRPCFWGSDEETRSGSSCSPANANIAFARLPVRTDDRIACASRATSKQRSSLQYGNAWEAFSEKNRSHHQAIQARRGERGASGSGIAGHHSYRSKGFWPSEGPRRTLSRCGIHRRLPP